MEMETTGDVGFLDAPLRYEYDFTFSEYDCFRTVFRITIVFLGSYRGNVTSRNSLFDVTGSDWFLSSSYGIVIGIDP